MIGKSTWLGRNGLRPLSRGLLRLHRTALRAPRATLALAALVALAALAQIPRTRVHLNIRDMADPELPSSRWADEMERTFGAGHSVLVLFTPRAAGARFTPPELEAIRAWAERERRQNPEVVRVTSPFDLLRAERVNGRLTLVPAVARATPDALASVRDTPWGGILTDREGRDVAVELVLRDTQGSTFFGRFDPAPIAALWSRCQAEVVARQPGIEARLSGNAAFDHFALGGVERFQVLNVAVTALLVLLCRALLGTWRSGFLLGALLAWVGLAVYGGMAASGAPIDLLSMGLFLMLSVAGIEDFVFIVHAALAQGGSWRTPFRRLLLPGFLTSVTTVVGFGSLCVSELGIIRRFGLWGAIGAVLEWIGTFLVLPALLAAAPRLRAYARPARALALRLPERILAWRLPAAAAWPLLGVLGLAAFGAGRLSYADSPVAMFPQDHPYRRTIGHFEATRGWVGQLHVVFPEDASAREVEQASRELAATPGVARVLDPGSVIRFWTKGDQLALFELAAESRKIEEGAGGLRAPDGRLRAAVFVSDAHLPSLVALRDAIAARWPGGEGFPAGELVSYADFGERVPRTLMDSLVVSLALVGLVIVLLFSAAGQGFGVRAALASLWGPAVTLILLWASQLPVNLITATFASVLVGITGDNAVQFACAARGGLATGIRRRGGAALIVTLLMVAASLTFLGAAFEPPRRVGLLMAAGLVAAVAGDVWLLGGLFRSAERGVPGREGRAP